MPDSPLPTRHPPAARVLLALGAAGLAWVTLVPRLVRVLPSNLAPETWSMLLHGGILAAATGYLVFQGNVWRGLLGEARKDLDRETAHFLDFFDQLPLGALLFDGEGRTLRSNPRAREILDRSEADLLAFDWKNPAVPILQADGHPLPPRLMPLNAALERGEAVRGVVLGLERPSDGAWAWVSLMLHPRKGADGSIQEVLCTFEDVTLHKTQEAELTLATLRDPLTTLPNRSLFMERLAHALPGMVRRSSLTAVLFLDLDRFKVINDSMSHEAGDRLLIQVAKRLRGCLRPMDTVARLGGDEFVVLFEDLVQATDAMVVADRISKSLEQPFSLDGQDVYTSCSMGLAVAESPEAVPSDLVRDAEVAMYRAKAKGEGRLEIFDPSMNEKALERLRMESEMRQGLDRGEFLLHYQPLVLLEGGIIQGWEALVRWRHPERGMVSPAEFIPLAEETGLIVPLGQWVLEEACRQIRLWNLGRGPGDLVTMNVNLSARQFQQRGLVQLVRETLRALKVDPGYLKLEITESVMMRDPHSTRDTLMAFRDSRVRLAIDDFGTGYSSLAYLKRFPVDTLKIDKTFIDGLGKDAEDTAIVEAIISLSKSLGIRVTAEGIESRDQFHHLRRLGCDQGQGYYFSKPLPAEAATQLLGQDPRW